MWNSSQRVSPLIRRVERNKLMAHHTLTSSSSFWPFPEICCRRVSRAISRQIVGAQPHDPAVFEPAFVEEMFAELAFYDKAAFLVGPAGGLVPVEHDQIQPHQTQILKRVFDQLADGCLAVSPGALPDKQMAKLTSFVEKVCFLRSHSSSVVRLT
jgi:hypothetical protein